MKTLLLNISDIHVLSQDKPENEGLVLSKFIVDVEEQNKKFVYDDVYVLIGGDLVFAASDESYSKFDKVIVQELMRIFNIDRTHFLIVPGNHDVMQNCVKDVEDSFLPIFNSKYEENKFNDLIRKSAQHDIVFGKFSAFKKYMNDEMGWSDYSLSANMYAINDTWSIHTLNTAVLSCGAYKEIDDRGCLGIDSRSLHAFICQDKHPKKILLMHHPEYFCMDWVKHELRKLYGSEYALVLSGHTHDQDLFCDSRNGYIRCEAPQLFTDKYDDILGYNFIEIENDQVIRITYREWLEKRNRFRPGSAFTDDDETPGIISFVDVVPDNLTADRTDRISIMMQERLRREMQSYAGQPYIWVERYLSDDRIDQVFKMQESTMFSELDIIKNGENIHAVAPSQYGLTCYGSHFLLTLWETQRQFGIKIDAEGVRVKKFERLVEEELEHYGKNASDVKWIVIDNWKPYRKDQKGISAYIKQNFPDAHVLMMTIYHESEFVDGKSFDETVIESKTLYLTPIKRAQERMMVDAYNKEKFIDDSDEVLMKLDEDIKNFNLHRSPHSCATLLTVFKDSFDRNPVNRTDVLENILSIIFDNTRLPHYKSNKPDAKDCDFCLGYFCSQLIKKVDSHFFTRRSFNDEIGAFCKKKDYDVDVEQLFDILAYNKIIVEDHGCYKFHFTFWVYYFVASWMISNDDYADEMLLNQKYLHYPEVLEFYTGKDRRRKNAVETLIKDLGFASQSVQAKTGMKEQDDPFAFLRFNQNKEREDAIINQIESRVMQSNLPQAIKDQTADLQFNPSAAFHQEIFKVYSDFSVGYLVNIIRIGSKVLRNSVKLDADIKQKLLAELVSAMKVLSNIIYLVSPLFAKQGFIQLTDYGFKLSKAFSKLDEKERTIRILVTIPYNLTMMFKEDIFSSKLSPVFISALKIEKDKVKRHLLASLLVYKQPEGWGEALMSYMDTIGKNSYYLGTLLELMLSVLQNGDLDEPEQMRIKNLIKSAIYKANNGELPKSQGELNQIELTREMTKGEDDGEKKDKED